MRTLPPAVHSMLSWRSPPSLSLRMLWLPPLHSVNPNPRLHPASSVSPPSNRPPQLFFNPSRIPVSDSLGVPQVPFGTWNGTKCSGRSVPSYVWGAKKSWNGLSHEMKFSWFFVPPPLWNDWFHIRGTQIFYILRQNYPLSFSIFTLWTSVSSRLRTKRYVKVWRFPGASPGPPVRSLFWARPSQITRIRRFSWWSPSTSSLIFPTMLLCGNHWSSSAKNWYPHFICISIFS